MNVAERRKWLVVLARVVDVAALALVGLGVYVMLQGGFATRLFGIRIFSFRSEARIFTWALGLLVLRYIAVPRPTLPEWIFTLVRDAARAAGPLPSDRQLLGDKQPGLSSAKPRLPRRDGGDPGAAVRRVDGPDDLPAGEVSRDRGAPRYRRPAAVDVETLLDRAPDRPRSAPLVRCQHLLSLTAYARLFRCDAGAGAHGRASRLARRAPAGRLQPAVPVRIRAVGRRHVRPRPIADRKRRPQR